MQGKASYSHAGVIVVRDQGHGPEYLLVRSSDGSHWVFPKGHIEPGETPEAAALRELAEEAGVVADPLGPTVEADFSRGKKQVRVIYYLMRYRGRTEAREQRDQIWVPRSEAESLLELPGLVDALRRAHELYPGHSSARSPG